MVGRLTDELERRLRHGLDPWVKIPGSYPQRRKWQPIPVFLPENPMDRGAWQAIVHGFAKSQVGFIS